VQSSKPKVLVAMSGGVDSSVAAALLLERGYDVVGCFMRLGSPGETLDELIPDAACDSGACEDASTPLPPSQTRPPPPRARRGINEPRPIKIGHQGCCSINDAADARLVAARLGIPFYVCNFKKDFGRIIDYFADEYLAGRTPNPCVRCNDWLKFGKLHEYAQQIGAEFVASGHYARIGNANTAPSSLPHSPRPTPHSPRLLRAVDPAKDQSYVLFGMPRAQLARTLLPIGEFEKPRVREMARERSLPVFDKPDSQEICFVPDNDYAGLVERRRPDAPREGAILDLEGRTLGEHDGQHHFTIGQRRGLSLSVGLPLYVISKSAANNTITVGPREALDVIGCAAHEANWLADVPARDEFAVLARYRSNGRCVLSRVRLLDNSDAPTPSGRAGRFEVSFNDPQPAVAAGQAIVLYDARDPDTVLGGGWITSTQAAQSNRTGNTDQSHKATEISASDNPPSQREGGRGGGFPIAEHAPNSR